MSFNSMTDNWKNCQSYDNVKKYIHERIKSRDSINTSSTTGNEMITSFTTVNNVNTRPKRMYCHDCSEYTESI